MSVQHRRRRSALARSAAAALLLAAGLAACAGTARPPASGEAVPTAMPAGTYTSGAFQPPVTFTVPDGWVVTADSRLYLRLQPAGNDAIGVHLFRDPLAASQDATCPAAPEPAVGGTSADLSAWIAARPGLAVSSPTMASVGGLRGVTLDIALRPDWVQACPFANGLPSVPLFNSPEIDHWVVVGNERLRVHLLDVPGGGTVAVDLDAFDGDQFEDLLSRAGGIVRSLEFATGGEGSGGPVTPAAPSP